MHRRNSKCIYGTGENTLADQSCAVVELIVKRHPRQFARIVLAASVPTVQDGLHFRVDFSRLDLDLDRYAAHFNEENPRGVRDYRVCEGGRNRSIRGRE